MAEEDGSSGGVALVGTASLHVGAFADTPPVSRTSGSAGDSAAPSFKRERFKKVDLVGERYYWDIERALTQPVRVVHRAA